MLVRPCSFALGLLLACPLTLSCATSGEVPPGDELEFEEDASGVRRKRDGRGHTRVPDDRQPTQDELVAAFDAPAPSAMKGPGLSGTGKVPPREPLADPKAAARQSFEEAARSVRQKLADKAFDDALKEAQQLARMAKELGPAQGERAVRLQLEAASGKGDLVEAARLAERGLLSCGPDGVDVCRAGYLREWRSALRAGKNARALKDVDALKAADGCLKKLEAAARRRKSEPPCTSEAQRRYRSARDSLMQARVAIAQAQLRGDRDALASAARVCTEPRCALVREQALTALVDAELAAQRPEAAARAAFAAMEAKASLQEPEERLYGWTPEATRACEAYDAAEGAGRCRALEQRVLGRHTFRDYSRGAPAGEGLSVEQVREVNAHYAPTLQRCLTEEAARLRAPMQERYTVRWVVLNDGRVGELHLDRKELDDGPLANCLRAQFSLWRYPRYTGEYQHVEQSFLVTARTRR